MDRREAILAYVALITVCLIWGTTYLAIRVAVRTLPDAWMAGVRFTVAGGLMALFFLIRGEIFPPLRQWIHLGVIGIALIGIGNWMVVWAEKVVPSGPTALLIATTPFWMAAIESISKKGEIWTRSKIGALLIGFSGVGLLIYPDLKTTWNPAYLWGVVAIQFGCIAWALGSIYSKYKRIESKPLVNASIQMLIGGVFLMIIAFFKGEFHGVHWERDGLIAFLYLIVFGAMIGYVCYIYALAKLPSSIVSLYAYINPVIAVWLGWLILGERITVFTFLATAVILCGVWMIQRARSLPQRG